MQVVYFKCSNIENKKSLLFKLNTNFGILSKAEMSIAVNIFHQEFRCDVDDVCFVKEGEFNLAKQNGQKCFEYSLSSVSFGEKIKNPSLIDFDFNATGQYNIFSIPENKSQSKIPVGKYKGEERKLQFVFEDHIDDDTHKYFVDELADFVFEDNKDALNCFKNKKQYSGDVSKIQEKLKVLGEFGIKYMKDNPDYPFLDNLREFGVAVTSYFILNNSDELPANDEKPNLAQNLSGEDVYKNFIKSNNMNEVLRYLNNNIEFEIDGSGDTHFPYSDQFVQRTEEIVLKFIRDKKPVPEIMNRLQVLILMSKLNDIKNGGEAGEFEATITEIPDELKPKLEKLQKEVAGVGDEKSVASNDKDDDVYSFIDKPVAEKYLNRPSFMEPKIKFIGVYKDASSAFKMDLTADEMFAAAQTVAINHSFVMTYEQMLGFITGKNFEHIDAIENGKFIERDAFIVIFLKMIALGLAGIANDSGDVFNRLQKDVKSVHNDDKSTKGKSTVQAEKNENVDAVNGKVKDIQDKIVKTVNNNKKIFDEAYNEWAKSNKFTESANEIWSGAFKLIMDSKFNLDEDVAFKFITGGDAKVINSIKNFNENDVALNNPVTPLILIKFHALNLLGDLIQGDGYNSVKAYLSKWSEVQKSGEIKRLVDAYKKDGNIGHILYFISYGDLETFSGLFEGKKFPHEKINLWFMNFKKMRDYLAENDIEWPKGLGTPGQLANLLTDAVQK